jgi:hypothetical protein
MAAAPPKNGSGSLGAKGVKEGEGKKGKLVKTRKVRAEIAQDVKCLRSFMFAHLSIRNLLTGPGILIS